MKLKNRIIALLVASAVAVPAIAAGKFVIADKSKSSVKVVAKIPASTIVGKASNVTIDDNGTTFLVNVGLGSVDTDMDLRNRHFQERMRSLHSSLALKTADVKSKIAAGKGVLDGKLTINEITKDVKVEFKLEEGSADKHHVTATIVGGIKRKDFKIGEPRNEAEKKEHGDDSFCYMKICVGQKIEISADLWVSKG